MLARVWCHISRYRNWGRAPRTQVPPVLFRLSLCPPWPMPEEADRDSLSGRRCCRGDLPCSQYERDEMRDREPSLAERKSTSDKAKQAQLERARAKAPANDPKFAERQEA